MRYVGLRLLKPQGVFFADGSDCHHYEVVTHLDWSLRLPFLLFWRLDGWRGQPNPSNDKGVDYYYWAPMTF